jgi:hypothetical protein
MLYHDDLKEAAETGRMMTKTVQTTPNGMHINLNPWMSQISFIG